MAKAWAKFPYSDKKYQYTATTLKKAWDRLHKGDAEALPKSDALVDAWLAFHAGEFQKAAELGLKAGADGTNVANKAQAIYANYLEENDKRKLELFQEVAERAEALQRSAPKNAECVLLAGLRARSLRAGHLGRQGADAGHRRQGQDGAGDGDQARAEACRCAYRARVLSRRSDRQGRRDDWRDDLWRQEGRGTEEFPDGAQAGTQIQLSRASSTPTAW